MDDDELTSISISMPLDSDGFLRRECPTCEREFKWLPGDDEEDEQDAEAADGGYFCPYCGVQAPPSDWLTKSQAAHVQAAVEQEVMGPMLDEFARSLGDLGRRSGGLIRAEVSGPTDRPELEPLAGEEDDMRRVTAACHPTEPLKVLEDWSRPTFCLVCGLTVS